MNNEELLDAIRGIVKEEVAPIKATQEEHTKELKSLNVKVDGISEKIDMTYDEMARAREDITDIKDSIEELTDKQDVIEGVTANNWAELVKMRNRKKQA